MMWKEPRKNNWDDKRLDVNQIEELQEVARTIEVQTINWCGCLQTD